MRPRAITLVAVAAVLLILAVVIGRSQSSPPGIDEAAAERIATDLVAQWEASDSDAQIVDVVVERYEDHGNSWRVTVRADLLVGRPKQPITYHYQIDIDKQTATPSVFAQG